jgi:hypothetical protein
LTRSRSPAATLAPRRDVARVPRRLSPALSPPSHPRDVGGGAGRGRHPPGGGRLLGALGAATAPASAPSTRVQALLVAGTIAAPLCPTRPGRHFLVARLGCGVDPGDAGGPLAPSSGASPPQWGAPRTASAARFRVLPAGWQRLDHPLRSALSARAG